MTRSAVSWLTRPRVSGLSARETVPGCTWAARATSRIGTDDDRTAPIMQTFAGGWGRSREHPVGRRPGRSREARAVPRLATEVALALSVTETGSPPRRGGPRPRERPLA